MEGTPKKGQKIRFMSTGRLRLTEMGHLRAAPIPPHRISRPGGRLANIKSVVDTQDRRHGHGTPSTWPPRRCPASKEVKMVLLVSFLTDSRSTKILDALSKLHYERRRVCVPRA
jgi:hypothetical protein